MRNGITICSLVFIAFLVAGVYSIPNVRGDDSSRISIEKLQALLGRPDLVILDVRIEKHWRSSTTKIRGAVREKPSKFDVWLDTYAKGRIIVLY